MIYNGKNLYDCNICSSKTQYKKRKSTRAGRGCQESAKNAVLERGALTLGARDGIMKADSPAGEARRKREKREEPPWISG